MGTAREDVERRWLRTLSGFETHRGWAHADAPAQMRLLLRDLHGLLSAAPPNLLQNFADFTEAELRRAASRLVGRWDRRDPITEDASPMEALWQGCILLRALDEALLEVDESIQSDRPTCWLTPDGQTYIIPMTRPAAKGAGPRDRQHFTRRGILRHRIVPRRIEDVDIEIVSHPDIEATEGEMTQRCVGLAIFSDFELDWEPVGTDRFRVTGAKSGDDHDAAVDGHCEEARGRSCDIVVWPELTMPESSVQRLGDRLARNALDTSRPPILVAGSWHRPTGDRYHNVGTALDGRGTVLCEFGKSRRFDFGGRAEDIVPHGTIHVVATETELIAIAICKDFCDAPDGRLPPVTRLDVDLAIVPSMGELTTILAQRDAASSMKVTFGTRTAVAQQHYPLRTPAPPKGYVLACPSRPNQLEEIDLRTDDGFTSFHIDT